jgi:DNA-binding XRE family transcriptional regulator
LASKYIAAFTPHCAVLANGMIRPNGAVATRSQFQEELARFGSNVRRERARQNITQEKLAELVDLNIRTVQKIEAGKLNVLITTASRIQRALRCKWDSLMP